MRMEINDEKVKYLLNNYLQKIKDFPEEVWLWGSQTYGTLNKYSDINLIVVSDKFSKIKFIRRMCEFTSEIGLSLDRKTEIIDALCYIPEEFERKKQQGNVINKAIKKGIRLI